MPLIWKVPEASGTVKAGNWALICGFGSIQGSRTNPTRKLAYSAEQVHTGFDHLLWLRAVSSGNFQSCTGAV